MTNSIKYSDAISVPQACFEPQRTETIMEPWLVAVIITAMLGVLIALALLIGRRRRPGMAQVVPAGQPHADSAKKQRQPQFELQRVQPRTIMMVMGDCYEVRWTEYSQEPAPRASLVLAERGEVNARLELIVGADGRLLLGVAMLWRLVPGLNRRPTETVVHGGETYSCHRVSIEDFHLINIGNRLPSTRPSRAKVRLYKGNSGLLLIRQPEGRPWQYYEGTPVPAGGWQVERYA